MRKPMLPVMPAIRRTCCVALFAFVLVPLARAQQSPAHFAESFLSKFNASAQHLLALAEATPADKFSWSPGEGVMSIERVYMHIAHYNYMYPVQNMGAEAPEGLDMDAIESITGKEAVISTLRTSLDYTRKLVESLSASELGEATVLYGRNTQKWDVLFQLHAHMSEHVGQQIAYARMNGIVPPWSR